MPIFVVVIIQAKSGATLWETGTDVEDDEVGAETEQNFCTILSEQVEVDLPRGKKINHELMKATTEETSQDEQMTPSPEARMGLKQLHHPHHHHQHAF